MSLVYLVHLVYLVCLVYLVHLVSFVQPDKPNKPDKPNNILSTLVDYGWDIVRRQACRLGDWLRRLTSASSAEPRRCLSRSSSDLLPLPPPGFL
jgi:hypothetical protein